MAARNSSPVTLVENQILEGRKVEEQACEQVDGGFNLNHVRFFKDQDYNVIDRIGFLR